ncbi:MAG: sigma-54-dependent Fis family transcriptional regulator [Deltaproteobacteria bacterium]|nr:sigma-54-dependent Fis family transcriptional regulator [Deltaproteobacteria bacterium]MBI5810477.1 sigma-54-dependent Fis family transcriptional regulator [Deltaproteobacteria bacterium]
MSQANSILVVDDEADMRAAIKEALLRKGYSVDVAGDGKEAVKKIGAVRYGMVISDVKMPGMDGMALLREVKKASPELPVLLVTAFGTVAKAVSAVKEGAVDFILKPFTLDALEAAVEKAFRDGSIGAEGFETKGKAILTSGPLGPMRKVISMALTAASCDATVLISGESGTGKELFARFIHSRGARSDKPFVAVNCASIPDGLLESELFGHERGAFTGAVSQRQGRFEAADTGTMLLDEISEMDMKLQAKLLRVIQEKEVERLGGKEPIPLDIRIIATTNRDMKKEVREGRFREDLYYRLNIFPLTLPPLRERKDDIMTLANHFMRKFTLRYGRHLETISKEAEDYIRSSVWRGNIRELENTIERAVLVSRGTTLGLEHMAGEGDGSALNTVTEAEAPMSEAVNEKAKNMTIWEMEKGLIYKTLDDAAGNRTKAAETLGISVRTLRNKLKEYGQNLPG